LKKDRLWQALFLLALTIVLIGQVLNLFLHFDRQTRHLLNVFMFCLLGIWYIVESFSKYHNLLRFIILFSGLFLVIMNFILMTITWYFVAIACLIVPAIIIVLIKKGKPSSVGNTD